MHSTELEVRSSRVIGEHVTKSSSKPFDRVIVDFEKQLGRANMEQINQAVACGNAQSQVSAMEGSSGLMIFAMLDMGACIPSLKGKNVSARQYLIGNPLIADTMIRHNTEVGLYVPLRVFISENDPGSGEGDGEGSGEGDGEGTRKGTSFVYDKPSSLLGQWSNEMILDVARELDRKLEDLTDNALN